MNLYEKFIEAIRPTWEDSEPFPRYQDRDEESFRVLHLNQQEFEFLKYMLREDIATTEWVLRGAYVSKKDMKRYKKQRKTLSEIQRKLKNESRP